MFKENESLNDDNPIFSRLHRRCKKENGGWCCSGCHKMNIDCNLSLVNEASATLKFFPIFTLEKLRNYCLLTIKLKINFARISVA